MGWKKIGGREFNSVVEKLANSQSAIEYYVESNMT